MDNTNRSSLIEMDNLGRGRVNQEPGSLPDQPRPHGDADDVPTHEQEEGRGRVNQEPDQPRPHGDADDVPAHEQEEGRGRVNQEPGSLPDQPRPHGDDDGVPTHEQEEGRGRVNQEQDQPRPHGDADDVPTREQAEGHLPTQEEVMAGGSVPEQASESPDRQWTTERVLIFTLFALFGLVVISGVLLIVWLLIVVLAPLDFFYGNVSLILIATMMSSIFAGLGLGTYMNCYRD